METSTTAPAAETTDTTAVAPTVTNSPSEKFVSYLLRVASESNASQEETLRQVIEATWERATTAPKASGENLVVGYSQSHNNLLNRLYVAAEVARNTARKMTHGLPADLYWARFRGEIQITGITRTKERRGTPQLVDITSQVAGGLTLEPTDEVSFMVNLNYSGNRAAEGKLPVSLLNNDPIAVAQMVRIASRAYGTEEIRKEAQALRDEQEELLEEISSKTKKLDEVKEKAVIQATKKPIKPSHKDKPKRVPAPAAVA